MTQTLLYLAGILLCVILSGFFSGSEMAYSSCSSLRLEHLRDDGSKRAGVAARIADRFDDALSAILIGNNLVNIAASSLGAVLVVHLTGGDSKVWLATLIITVIIIIFGETIPKITCKKNANRVAVRYAYPVRALMLILKPLVWLVVKAVGLLTRSLKGEEDEDAEEAVEELQSIIETAEDEEVLDEDQSELVQAAIEFDQISASEVMTARVDVCAIDIEDDWEEILSLVEEAPYSRLPVYEGEPLPQGHDRRRPRRHPQPSHAPLLRVQDHEAARGAEHPAQGPAAPGHRVRRIRRHPGRAVHGGRAGDYRWRHLGRDRHRGAGGGPPLRGRV